MSEYLGERAIVLGGGMAGLITARVLSDRYRTVVVVDRDKIIDVTEPRHGVPQGRHAHALLPKGQQILENLFPGLLADLAASSDVLVGDLSGDLRWYFNGKPLQQAKSGLLTVSATRPVLESYVRARVVALPNVEIREHTGVDGPETSADGQRVTGVRLTASGEPGHDELMMADLVVDATGRGSRAPAWLEGSGFDRPHEERVNIDLAYVSRFFLLDSDPFGADLAINPVAWPGNPHGAFFGKFPGNTALLSLTGLLGGHPPRDHEGFLEFTRTLAAPEVYQAVRSAEPLGDVAACRFPASVRRRYDQLRAFPAGFLVIGDGVCSFNPVYGQGMTVAAMEAAVLAEHLRHGEARPLQFFREISPVIDVPWETSSWADLAFPGVQGARTLKVKLGNAYIARLHNAAGLDGRFAAAFFRVAGLVDPPQTLMRPRMILGVLRTSRRAGAGSPARPAEEKTGGSKKLAA